MDSQPWGSQFPLGTVSSVTQTHKAKVNLFGIFEGQTGKVLHTFKSFVFKYIFFYFFFLNLYLLLIFKKCHWLSKFKVKICTTLNDAWSMSLSIKIEFSSLPCRGTRSNLTTINIDWLFVGTFWVCLTQSCYYKSKERARDKFIKHWILRKILVKKMIPSRIIDCAWGPWYKLCVLTDHEA